MALGLVWLVAALVVVAVALGAWVRMQGRLALRAAAARPLAPGESPRLVSLVRGLAGDLGLGMPQLWVFEAGGPNAFVCYSSGPCVAVSPAVLESFSRTELEAVVAHCLVRVAGRRLRRQQLAIALGRTDHAGAHIKDEDVAAANLTRYPPALAGALRKCEPQRGRFSPLYLVGEASGHPVAEERAAELLDL